MDVCSLFRVHQRNQIQNFQEYVVKAEAESRRRFVHKHDQFLSFGKDELRKCSHP
jgi:hypothetical protein